MLCVIPARSGSKRIPKKNIKEFHGRPIIEYSIETALKSNLFDKIVVSVDQGDDDTYEIVYDFGHSAGVDLFLRSKELESDEAGTQDVVKDVLLNIDYKPEYVCCLYATSPLLKVAELARGINKLKSSNLDYAFSVGTNPLCDAGNFYWGKREAFIADVPLVSERSIMIPIELVCDINTPEDWARAEEMYSEYRSVLER